jgi:hypothetical protein
VLIPWEVHQNFENHGSVQERYYHLFERGELEVLCATFSKQCVVRESFFDKENWCVLLTRIAEADLPVSSSVGSS